MNSVSPPAVRDAWIAGLVFAFTFAVHGLSPNATPFDSRWTVHTALSVLHEGNTDLNEYAPLLERGKFYAIECVWENTARKYPLHGPGECENGRYYNFYPAAVALLATPQVGLLEAALRVGRPWLGPLAARMGDGVPRRLLEGDLAGSYAAVELLVASSWMALAAALIYLAAREVAGRPVAAAAAGIFAFCTPAWSTASRALWQHGPSILLLSAALLLALWAEKRPGVAPFLGIPLALAFFVRPTNAVPAALLTVYVLLHHRRHLTGFLGCALAVALLFDFYNTAVYGTSLAPYSFVRRENAAGLSLHERLPEALAGNLFSPARGLFVYMPVALLAAVGAALRPPGVPWRRLRPFLAGSVVLHWVLVSTYEDWWGGHCYGPRYMSEMVPFLVFLLIPVLERASCHLAARRYALPAALAFLTAASLGLNCLGACHWSVYEWNSKPREIRTAEWRVWDWTDPPFLRPFRE